LFLKTAYSKRLFRKWILRNHGVYKGHHMTCLCRHRGNAGVLLQPIRSPALGGRGWSAPRSGLFTPGNNLILIVPEAGLASEPVWTAWDISLLPGVDPRTVQSIATCCIDYPIPTRPPVMGYTNHKLFCANYGCSMLLSVLFCIIVEI
jgi:hypothetical protein